MIETPQVDLSAVTPLLLVAIGALVVLLLELFFSGRPTFLGRRMTRAWIGSVLALVSTLFLALVALVASQNFALGQAPVFNPEHPLVRLDRFANFAIVLVSLAALLSCLLSVSYLAEMNINHGEYYALLLLATSGMVLLVSAVDLVTVFLGIEIMSIPTYVLAGFDRGRLRSNESALKYFLIGSFASAFLLYGMALVFGATGATSFDGIRAGFDPENRLAAVGLALLIVGFTFKISSVPFHQWTPDVYEGSPTSVTAWMSVTVKVAAFAALLRLLASCFGAAGENLQSLLWVLALLTMLVGNFMALIQENLKRLLAYSSIAHAGYLLIGFAVASEAASAAILFYLLVYVFMNLGAFAVIVALANRGHECERISDLAGLARSRPVLAALMTLFMVSLAGLPGTGGFMAKFTLFSAAVAEGETVLVVLAVLTTLVSFAYYLRLPAVMYMQEPEGETRKLSLSSGEWTVLAVCAAAVVLLGIVPNNLSWLQSIDWSAESAAILAQGVLD